ncbi:restriction endonuclease subunit S [Blautia faecis]|uniref:restriction endonuclease subunit S n=1 Tax=Blautia faecis TaxID=871665 RepID=UPI001D08AD2D|nr:restriction endonuclease subunit S [Blautia faecis]MCB6331069.1 restriction endonuclease subunit S [Blautia faecis]
MTGQQLKNSILQMAVQGKLVPQDPNDEPASVLLARIRKEKEELIKAGKIKKEKNPSYIFRGADNLPYEKVGKNEPVCIADEVPFEIPDSWEWVRIKNLGAIIRGSGIKRNETVESGFPCVRYGEIYTTYNTSFTSTVSFIPEEINEKCKHFSYGDILMTLTGENKPDIAKAVACLGEKPVAAGGDLAFWTAHGMNPLYLAYLLASPYVISRKVELATGDIIVHISGDKIGSILIPIPPLNEQMRIVEKIQETECQIRQYSEKEQELTTLHKAFPETLKKSILLQAVQGKLVEQDPTDEPTEILLERIRAKKQRLVKEGKVKKNKHESIIFRRDNSHYEKLDGIERCIDDEIPFKIPNSWVWTRFGQVISLLSGTDFKPEEYNDQQQGTPYITGASSLSEDGVLLNRWTETPRNIATKGDILLVCKGSGYGKTVICDIEEAHIARQIMAIKKLESLNMQYVRLFLQANFDHIKSKGQGVIPGIDRNSVMELLFPIPPLSEQYRIVEKQRELFDGIMLI